jgi:hypothetical protein
MSEQNKPIDPIAARVALVNGNFDLPTETKRAMKRITEIVAEAAAEIEREAKKVKYDTGRLIATMDILQQSKDTACVSVILPHYKPEAEEKDDK